MLFTTWLSGVKKIRPGDVNGHAENPELKALMDIDQHKFPTCKILPTKKGKLNKNYNNK